MINVLNNVRLISCSSSESNLAVGDRVIVSSGLGSRPGILKYIGETKFATGNWCGVMLDDATGKNDGVVDGERYNCSILTCWKYH